MEHVQLQGSGPDRRVGNMARVAEAELDRIARSSDAATERLVDLMEEATRLRLERDKLQLELARAQGRALTRLAVRLERLGWGVRRLLAPVGAVRGRALAALAMHGLDRETGLVRLVFDPAWYRSALATAGDTPVPDTEHGLLRHYITRGEARGLRPTPLLDPHFYARQTAGVVPGQGRALIHFLEHGLHLATPPRAGLESLALRALADGQTPAVWLFAFAAEPAQP